MRRHDEQRADLEQMFDHGRRERGAFFRIRSRSELVEQYE